MGNNKIKTSPFKSHFFIIGILMLIGGSMQLFVTVGNEVDPSFPRIILHSITALGGLAFLFVAFKNKT